MLLILVAWIIDLEQQQLCCNFFLNLQNGGLSYNNGSSLHNRGAKKKNKVTSELVSTAVNTMQYNYNDIGDQTENNESPFSHNEVLVSIWLHI